MLHFGLRDSGIITFLCLVLLPLTGFAQQEEPYEFFERKIRPLLTEKCYACHSSATMAMGELRLDSKAAVLKGGSRGASVIPGDPAGSLLLKAVSYQSLELRMPPTGKLADDEIASLESWIRMGLQVPRMEITAQPVQDQVDVADGKDYWSFQPVIEHSPPDTQDITWVRNALDHFILARLESENLKPSKETDHRTLLRRLTFDLTGLPPTPAEIAAFLADSSEDAYEKVVERLLASPHYGERWGRHWLDLVRWAETNGHEFDNNKLDAWRYRDYVIESFNSDLPYNRFLQEQIAGDLMLPRASVDGTHYINPVASGVYWLWEVLNSPTDSVKARADQIDNQIDVMTKAMQGLTVACARCHDHKFDPIPTADYYSLFGIFNSTQMSEICVDTPERLGQISTVNNSIAELNADLRSLLKPALSLGAESLAERLLEATSEKETEETEETEGLSEELQYALTEPSHPLYPFARSVEQQPQDFVNWMTVIREEMSEWSTKSDRAHPIWAKRGDLVYDDFEQGFSQWTVTGSAFGVQPVRKLPPNVELAGDAGQSLASSFGSGSNSLVGTLTTQKFMMPAKFVHVRLAGPQHKHQHGETTPIRFTVIADEHKSGHAIPDGSGRLKWHKIAMIKERGRICSMEIIDRDRSGSIVVDQIVFSASPEPPPIAGPVHPRVLALLENSEIRSLEDLALAYEELALDLAGFENLSARDEALISDLLGYLKLEQATEHLLAEESAYAADLTASRDSLDAAMPASTFAMSSIDNDPADVAIHVRGNHKNPGEIAPRQFLQVVDGTNQQPYRDGSGRLALARRIASEENPLTARVMVNRVWEHHFGKGIVDTPDNFGRMGKMPSHPELLDYLSKGFMAQDWSVKELQRRIVLSSTYRMHSQASSQAQQRDPGNELLSHFPVRRLEAEAIRDSVLAISGSLDFSVGGPSIPPHISEYQDGRGKPTSGPLDGLGRRSIYIQLRRNFLPPLFLAFDYPLPISTAGRRGVSAVPSQALLLLNNEFINRQASLWATRQINTFEQQQERIKDMYVRAYGRLPMDSEVEEIERFLADQSSHNTEPGAWTDLAHAMLNTTEFLFIR